MAIKPPIQGDLSTLRTTAIKSRWSGLGRTPTLPPVNGYCSPAIEALAPQLTLVPDAPVPPKRKRKPKVKPVPNAKREARVAEITDDAIEAYNRILAKPNGVLAPVTRLSIETRRKQVDKCVDAAIGICEQHFGDRRITPEFWSAYFMEVSFDEFQSGRRPSANMPGWKPTFEYLIHPDRMVKIFEQAQAR